MNPITSSTLMQTVRKHKLPSEPHESILQYLKEHDGEYFRKPEHRKALAEITGHDVMLLVIAPDTFIQYDTGTLKVSPSDEKYFKIDAEFVEENNHHLFKDVREHNARIDALLENEKLFEQMAELINVYKSTEDQLDALLHDVESIIPDARIRAEYGIGYNPITGV